MYGHNHIPFLTNHYTAHHAGHGSYVVKCAGEIIPGGRFDDGQTRAENHERAANRCYQLNRARNL
jgi:hypothetical protein